MKLHHYLFTLTTLLLVPTQTQTEGPLASVSPGNLATTLTNFYANLEPYQPLYNKLITTIRTGDSLPFNSYLEQDPTHLNMQPLVNTITSTLTELPISWALEQIPDEIKEGYQVSLGTKQTATIETAQTHLKELISLLNTLRLNADLTPYKERVINNIKIVATKTNTTALATSLERIDQDYLQQMFAKIQNNKFINKLQNEKSTLANKVALAGEIRSATIALLSFIEGNIELLTTTNNAFKLEDRITQELQEQLTTAQQLAKSLRLNLQLFSVELANALGLFKDDLTAYTNKAEPIRQEIEATEGILKIKGIL